MRGSVAVAARCRYGLPAVVRTAPLLPDGTPFPTLYWLACPAARVAVGRLEAAGWNAALSERVAAEPDLAAAHAAAHASYLAQRDAMARLPGDPGVGGLPGPGEVPPRSVCPPGRYRRRPGRPDRQPGRRPGRLPVPASTQGLMARLAALDVGTNSTRLLVADVEDGAIVATHRYVITRLGKGVDRTGRFDPAALARTLEVLAGYAETCRRLGAGRRRLVATSATRDAADRQVFLDGVRDLLGVEAEVLTGRAEAAAAHCGRHLRPDDRRTLVVDIGGGSTELILGDGATARAMISWTSAACGCSNATSTTTRPRPPRCRAPGRCRRPPGPGRRGPRPGGRDRVVGVAGTVTTVTAIALGMDTYDPHRIHHQTVDAAEITAVAGKLAAMTVAERAAMRVMAKGREDVIAAGALLLDELVQHFRLREVVASETDILDGVLLELAGRP